MKSSFESALWKEVRQAVQEDPDLQYWGRFNWWFRAKDLPFWLLRTILSLFSAMIAGVIIVGRNFINLRFYAPHGHLNLDHILTVINAWVLAGVIVLVLILPKIHRPSKFLAQLPASSAEVIRMNMGEVWQGMIVGLLELVLAFNLVAHFLHLSWLGYLTFLLLIPLNLIYTVALVLVLRLPPLPSKLGLVMIIIPFIIVLLPKLDDPIAAWENLLLPSAAPLYLTHLWLPNPDWKAALFLIPIGSVISTLPASLHKLWNRPDYSEEEALNLKVFDKPEPPQETTASDIEIKWNRPILKKGPVEQALWNWLTPRERKLASLMVIINRQISRIWAWIYGAFFIITINAFVMLHLFATLDIISFHILDVPVGDFIFYYICTLYLIIYLLLIFFIFANLLFFFFPRIIRTGGTGIHFVSVYPVTLRELNIIALKCTLIQLPLFAPISIVAVSIIAVVKGYSAFIGGFSGLELCITVCVLRLAVPNLPPFWPNFFYHYWLRDFVRFLSLLLNWLAGSIILFLALGAPFINWETKLPSLPFLILSLSLSYPCFLFYCALYRSQYSDLTVSIKKRVVSTQQLPWER